MAIGDYVYKGKIEVDLHGHGLDEAHRIMREAVELVKTIEQVDNAYQSCSGCPRVVYDGDRPRTVGKGRR